jgi:hypothetical protein
MEGMISAGGPSVACSAHGDEFADGDAIVDMDVCRALLLVHPVHHARLIGRNVLDATGHRQLVHGDRYGR